MEMSEVLLSMLRDASSWNLFARLFGKSVRRREIDGLAD